MASAALNGRERGVNHVAIQTQKMNGHFFCGCRGCVPDWLLSDSSSEIRCSFSIRWDMFAVSAMNHQFIHDISIRHPFEPRSVKQKCNSAQDAALPRVEPANITMPSIPCLFHVCPRRYPRSGLPIPDPTPYLVVFLPSSFAPAHDPTAVGSG